MTRMALGVLLLSLSAAGAVPRRPLKPAVAALGVSWDTQVLRATASGAPDVTAMNPGQARLGAERAAQADAFRGLLAAVEELPLRADHRVRDELGDPQVRARLENAVRAYRI